MPSPTDFNLSPYYDDFSKSKSFHRILFRPAFAVQARELTQAQSILQNQIENLSDQLFEKGAMVIPGEIGYDLNYHAVKLSAKSLSTLSNYVGVKITGATSGVEALVINSVVTDGTDPDTVFVKYTKTGTDNVATRFTDGETLNCTVNSAAATLTVNTTATGCAAEIQAGTYYINGFQVEVVNQVLVLDKYTNTPSYRVGLSVTESFITPNEDASLNDNAQGSSNQSAPGAHRFKIALTLAKLSLSSALDTNFVELLRLKSGIIQNQVRTTDYAVIEDTFARRTFDESGDYAVRDFDLDLREHLLSGDNRGVYSSGEGGLETKVAGGMGPGKAYVKGYEISTIGTNFVDIDKAREFDTQQNFPTRFDVQNYVKVDNIYGTPDVGFVSGDVEPFKNINLYDIPNAARGTQAATAGADVPQIGRAKSKGFEYNSGTATGQLMATSSGTAAVYKHYLFDIEMFTHLEGTTPIAFTTGETVTGGTSGATGTVQSISVNLQPNLSAATQANPVVCTSNAHGLQEGQQIKFESVGGMTQLNGNTYTVRNPAANTWELYDTDGTTSTDGTGFGSFTSGGGGGHCVVVVNNVSGEFVANEVITGGTSGNSTTLQLDAVGYKAVRKYDFVYVKQLVMAGTPTYTANAIIDGIDNKVLTGTMTVANSGTACQGFGTLFNTELKVGDQIKFVTDAGTTLRRTIECIISNESLQLSAAVGGSDVSTKTAITRERTKLQGSDKNISLFQLPYDTIKTLKTTANSGLTDTNFSIRKAFTETLSASGTASITAGTNETFAAHAEGDYSVSIMSTGGGGTGAVGDVITLAGGSVFTLGGSPTGKTLTIDLGSAYAGHKVKILGTVNRTVAGSKNKTLNQNQTVAISTQATIESGTISLSKADIYKINSIYMAPDFSTAATTSHTDITTRFELDNGQRDNFYDIGRIKLKTGEITPTGRLLINFDYFSHGTGDYFDVDSYSGTITYANIPSYTSDTTGKTYELSDVLDFRPRVDDASTISAGVQDRSYDGTGNSVVDVVKFNSDVTSDHEYYLNRIDKIFLDKQGSFKVSKGASAIIPQVPENLDGAMHLYTLQIPAYTLDPADISIKKIDNRRYTMRDIGKLEDRIQNVEYYTQLSLLEQSAQSLQIQDANGLDRFKNGFIVDNFTGHNIGDVGDKNYKISMDMAKGELRPMFNEDAIKLIERDDDGTAIVAADRVSANYQKTGDLLTMPYTETALITQSFASKAINVNPFDVFNWSGTIALSPDSDEWKETERSPELVINNTGGFDTLISGLGNPNLAGVEIGTMWNEWQDTWTGTPVDVGSTTTARGRSGRRVWERNTILTAQQVNQTRTGIRQRIVPQTVRNSIGDRIISVAFVPFIRSRTVAFTGTRMKPNTRVYPFFDNIDITAYCTPSGGSLGGNIVTDANGACGGSFAIPDPTNNANPRWRTGERVFRLTSSSTNSQTASAVETSAEADYVARGILETVQNTVISTREPRIERNNVTDNRNNVTRTSTRTTERTVGWVDPLAQTFMIDDVGGIFLTSMELYFQTKDDAIPITVQIREVVNGYPSNVILPFSEVTLNPGSVNVSTDASTATKFTFPSPVYLQENVEYSFVIMSNSNAYNCYVGRMGETVLGSNRTISAQPYAGVMFKSQNGSTWSAEQNEDVKFIMNRAEFNIVGGTVTLVNDTLPTRTLKDNPIRTTNASGTFRVFHPNHGMHGTSNNVTIAGVPSGTYNGIAHSVINGTHTTISNITLDSYDISLLDSTVATATGDVGGSAVTATQNRAYDVANLNIQTMAVPGTSLSAKMRPTTGKSLHGSESEFSLTSAASAGSVVTNDNIYCTSPKIVASEINETNEMSGSKSLFVTLTLASTNSKVSPVIDTQRMSMIAIQNRLTNPLSGNTPSFVADTAATGSSSSAQYITRAISLENPSQALDIRLTANVRSTSEIEMFYRTTSADESRKIEDLTWTPFNTDGSPDTAVSPAEDDDTFKEHKFSASSINSFTGFQLKIVLKGTVSSYPPVIKDMRGIALAV